MSWSHIKAAAIAVAFSSLVTTAASAAVAKKYNEWRNGPAQWIMTAEEKKEWRSVKSDEAAIRFIDLFWVRRDPTPGTSENEYRDQFDARVRYADGAFGERNKRGSMTDRGRVWIVLGEPTIGAADLKHATHHALNAGPNPGGGGRVRGARTTWIWEHADALKFDMPKVEVVFVEDPGTGKTQRDLHRPDWAGAERGAIRNAIASPGLTELPDWAPRGGLEPVVIVPGAATIPAARVTAKPAKGSVPVPQALPSDAPMQPAGASRLTLSKDVFSIDTEEQFDPFTKIAEAEAFSSADDLGWATQVCTGSSEEPTLKFTLRLTGTAADEVVDRLAPEDEMVPDRIRVLGGCYMLRGAVPLEGMNPGSYELEVAIYDPGTRQDHILKKAFRIE